MLILLGGLCLGVIDAAEKLWVLTELVFKNVGREIDRQCLTAMKSMWDTVGKLWKPAGLLTQLGRQFCQTRAANMLSLMRALTNGARASLFQPVLVQ